jgi:hypothetical protein
MRRSGVRSPVAPPSNSVKMSNQGRNLAMAMVPAFFVPAAGPVAGAYRPRGLRMTVDPMVGNGRSSPDLRIAIATTAGKRKSVRY